MNLPRLYAETPPSPAWAPCPYHTHWRPIACPLCGVGPALAVALEQHWSEMASLLGEPPYVPALSHGPCFQAFCALELTDAGVGILPRTPAPAGISLSPRAPAGRTKRTP